MANFFSDITDNLLSALGLSTPTQSWLTRLREEITLTSPKGDIFTARWRGNPHTITNKLGVHTFPGVSGARVQDLRSGEEIYSLAVLFMGKLNDINASAFMNALKNNIGDWTIEHPVKGPLFAVWMDATEHIESVTSGNITIVEVNFIINLPDSAEESAAQAQAQANFQASNGNISAADQFTEAAKQDGPGQIQSIITGVGKAITGAKKVLKVIDNASILDPRITAILTSIENTLSGDIIDTAALAGQIQAYIQIFGLGQSDAIDAVTMYADFAAAAIQDVPVQPNDDGLSTIATTELVVLAALIGATQSALIGAPSQGTTASVTAQENGGINSRLKVITVAQKLIDLFESVTEGLDNIQTLYEDRPIDKKYFSQSTAYADMLNSVSKSIRFLLLSLFGLPSEKRITLKKDTFVPQIVKNEYGFIGDETSETANIDLFIQSNNLIENDIYMLEAGRQVLIYV